MLGTWPPRLEICVVPAAALAERRRLLQALERAYSVRFTPFEEGVNPAALLAFGVDPPPLRDVPILCLAEPGHPDGMSSALEFLPDPLVPGSFPRSHTRRAGDQDAPARRGAGGHRTRADRP